MTQSRSSPQFQSPAREAPAPVAPTLQGIADTIGRLEAKVTRILSALNATCKSHYSVEEIAHLTGRSPYTVRRWISDGRIQAQRVTGTGPKGRLLVAHTEIRKLIEGGLGAGVPEYAADLRPMVPGDGDVA